METLLITNGILFTMDPQFRIFEHGSLLIEGDRITSVGPTDTLRHHTADTVIDATGKAILPGLINTHMHAGILRGLGDFSPLAEWLSKYIYPIARNRTPDDMYIEAKHAYLEALKAGTTCLMDNSRFMHRSADAAQELGIRANLAPYCGDRPQGDNYLDRLDDNEQLIRSRHNSNHGRIQVWVGLHGYFDSSPEYFHQARDLANRYQVGLHTHSSESRPGVDMMIQQQGQRPIECLHDWGWTGSDVVLAHCVWLSPHEQQLLSQTQTRVAHCPTSNMKLASGVAPIPDLLANHVTVGLGSDGIISKNNLDLFEEIKLAGLIHRLHRLDATLMPPHTLLHMATLGGASALGMDESLGSLEVGKKADVITVDLQHPRFTPVITGPRFNVTSHLAYTARGDDVTEVIIDGEIVIQDRVIQTVDEPTVRAEATATALNFIKYLPD